MRIQEQDLVIRRSGRKSFATARQQLIGWGFDLNLFRCEEEIQFAAHFVEDTIVDSEFQLVQRFGVPPAWIMGDHGPFLGDDGLEKLAMAFELGKQLGLNTTSWLTRHTSVEVIKMLPSLYN